MRACVAPTRISGASCASTTAGSWPLPPNSDHSQLALCVHAATSTPATGPLSSTGPRPHTAWSSVERAVSVYGGNSTASSTQRQRPGTAAGLRSASGTPSARLPKPEWDVTPVASRPTTRDGGSGSGPRGGLGAQPHRPPLTAVRRTPGAEGAHLEWKGRAKCVPPRRAVSLTTTTLLRSCT